MRCPVRRLDTRLFEQAAHAGPFGIAQVVFHSVPVGGAQLNPCDSNLGQNLDDPFQGPAGCDHVGNDAQLHGSLLPSLAHTGHRWCARLFGGFEIAPVLEEEDQVGHILHCQLLLESLRHQ